MHSTHTMRKLYYVFALILFSSAASSANMSLCDCLTKPIDTDTKHAECSKIFETTEPAKMRAERSTCLATIPTPPGGADVCFCLRSRSREPAHMKTCKAILEKIPDSEFVHKSRECARAIY